MKRRQASARGALALLYRIGAGAGLLLVFASGSLLSFVLYANLPAGRRVVAFVLQRTLQSTFQGRFAIEAIDRVSLDELRARGVTVYDPQGHLVLSVSALSVQADFRSLLQKVLFGGGAITLRFDHARLERAEVYLLPGPKDNIPSIADAFALTPTVPESPAPVTTRSLKVWLPEIEAGRIYGRMSLEGIPTLEAELSSVRGAVVGRAGLTTVDVERFSALVRGLGGADARGVGTLHVRAPGAVWTSFDGYFGDIQLGTVVRVDSPKLEVTLDVPRAEPAAMRALWADYPVRKDLAAHVEASGTLQSLHTQAKLNVEGGSLSGSGELRLSDHAGADFELSGRSLDARAIFANAPTTQLDIDSSLAVFQLGNEWIANVNGATRPTRIGNVPLPAIDVTGSYRSKAFTAHALLHEPGIPLQANFVLHADGSLDGDAQASHVDLSRAPRLAPYFNGQGLLDLKLKARIDKNRLVAQVNGKVDTFRYGTVSIASNQFSGRASGPLDALDKLWIDVSLSSQRLRAGALGFDELSTKFSGPVTRPLVSTTVHSQSGPTITAKAQLSARPNLRLEQLSAEVRRDQALLTAQAVSVGVNGDALSVRDLKIEGAGGPLTASAEIGARRVAIVSHGSNLDLGVIAQALGLPRGLLRGKLALDAHIDSSDKNPKGSFDVELSQAESDGIAIDAFSLSGTLKGSDVDLQSHARLRDFGNFSAAMRATLAGPLGEKRSYERATGVLTVKAEHVPIGLLDYVLPNSAGVEDVRGEGNATLVLDRADPKGIPNVSLVANTQGLYVALKPQGPSEKANAFEDVDAHAGLYVNGQSGESDVTLKLEDRHGSLASATAHLKLDLERAFAHPETLLEQLRTTPLVAKAVVEDRSLAELPAPLVPKGVSGRLRTEVSLRGSFDHPLLSDKTDLYRLRLGVSERDRAIDVCAQFDYDKSSGQYGARGELFLPTEGGRPCNGSRVAQFSAAGRAEWDKLRRVTPSADPAWTGTAGLALEGLPLDFVPSFAEAGFDGRVLGVVMFDRRDALPRIRSQLQIQDAVIARTRLGTASLAAQTDGRSLSATLDVEQPALGPVGPALLGGTLKASLQSSIDWQGVVPGIDETRPISASVSARNVDAVILSPFVHDVLSEIGGKLDADLSATLTPDLNPKAEPPWTGAVKGHLQMRDGTLQLAQLALRMRNVTISANAEPRADGTLITIDSLTAAAEATRTNVAARGNLQLSGFRVTRGKANATLQAVPLLVEGVTLATLTSAVPRRGGLNGALDSDRVVAIDLERRPTEMRVTLTIPELEARLPQAGTRALIGLGENDSIEITQPIAEPRGASGAALPWRLRFDLGSSVKLTRSDLFLPISGSPEIVLDEEMQILGNIDLRAGGRLSLPGLPRPFTIENGTVYFDPGADPKNPRLKVRAACQLSQLTIWATVTGTFRDAKIWFESDDPTLVSQAQIEAALLSAPTDSGSPATAGIGAGAGYLGKQLLANTPLSHLELKAGNETTADQQSYATYSAAYPITDEIWFEGSYKTLQSTDLTGSNTNAVSGTIDWRFRRNWSLRTELGNIGAGVDLLWLYRY